MFDHLEIDNNDLGVKMGMLRAIAMFMRTTDPTGDQFAAYRAMWAYFNTALFGGSLSHVFLNFSRLARSLGFFAPERWRNAGDQTTHEISLNPDHLTRRNVKDSASTLVHEMAHLWRHEQGNPPRGGYHDTKWADKMVEIGLMPSSTARPGGRRTGYKMSHYIVAGGAFERAFEGMPPECHLPWTSSSGEHAGGESGGMEGTDSDDEKDKAEKNKAEKARKVKLKYSCPSCTLNVWGRAGLRLRCSDCDEQLVTAGAAPERAAADEVAPVRKVA